MFMNPQEFKRETNSLNRKIIELSSDLVVLEMRYKSLRHSYVIWRAAVVVSLIAILLLK